jgi:hypothetical protein
VVRAPTVVAFYPGNASTAIDSTTDMATALDDFFYYFGPAQGSLEALGFQVTGIGSQTLRLVDGGKTIIFTVPKDSAELGYYFIAPGRPAVVYYGVQTGTDLVDAAKQYLRGNTRR